MHVPHNASRTAAVLTEAIEALPTDARTRVGAAAELSREEAEVILAGVAGSAIPVVGDLAQQLVTEWSTLSTPERTAALLVIAELLARDAG